MNRLIRLLLTFVCLIVTSESCRKTSTQNRAVVEKDGIEYSLETQKSIYGLGEEVSISFRVTNKTDMAKELGTVINCEYCMCQFQITLNDKDIWKNCRVPPPCGQKMFQLDPGESREYTGVWKMTNDNGTLEPEDDFPISKGKYKVTGELLGGKLFVLIEII